MSLEDLYYRKAEQYAHTEILALLVMVLGMVSLIGGLILSVVTTDQILVIPFIDQYPLDLSSAVGFALAATGFVVLSAGSLLTVYYERKKSLYLNEIDRADEFRDLKTDIKAVKRSFADFDKQAKREGPKKQREKQSEETS